MYHCHVSLNSILRSAWYDQKLITCQISLIFENFLPTNHCFYKIYKKKTFHWDGSVRKYYVYCFHAITNNENNDIAYKKFQNGSFIYLKLNKKWDLICINQGVFVLVHGLDDNYQQSTRESLRVILMISVIVQIKIYLKTNHVRLCLTCTTSQKMVGNEVCINR